MRGRTCDNRQAFRVWLDVAFQVSMGNGGADGQAAAREVHRAASEVNPVYCSGCGSSNVEVSEADWQAFWEAQ